MLTSGSSLSKCRFVCVCVCVCVCMCECVRVCTSKWRCWCRVCICMSVCKLYVSYSMCMCDVYDVKSSTYVVCSYSSVVPACCITYYMYVILHILHITCSEVGIQVSYLLDFSPLIHVCMHACMLVCSCKYACIFMCVCLYIHVCMIVYVCDYSVREHIL